MKKLLLLIIIIADCLNTNAQTERELETMMTRRVLRCDDIELNLIYLLPELHQQGKHNTIKALLNYADKKCSYRNTAISFEMLFAMEQDSFNISDYNPYSLRDELNYYLKRYNKTDSLGPSWYPILRVPDNEALGTYYAEVKKMGTGMAGRKFKTDLETKLINYYIQPSDSLYKELNKVLNSKGVSNAYYNGNTHRRNHNGGLHLSLSGGMWMPHGNLSAVGNHGYIGIQYGMGTRNIQVSATIIARFLDAPDSFNVLKGDSLYRSRNFGGAYYGIDASYAIVRGNHHEWSALGGIGLETLLALNNERRDSDDRITKRLYTPNINIGTGYKFWMNGAYIGLDLKYNVLFFRNKGGTNFSGNVFTFGLVFGLLAG